MGEVRNNLIADERRKALANFDGQSFKKVAVVIMGEPPADFKAKAYKLLLDEKKRKVGSEVRSKKMAEAAERKEKKRIAEEEKEKKEDDEGEDGKEQDAKEEEPE